ncbi:hypothetical protein [Tardiphaga sp.]|uniref:hypothetical protein n=1 Tax=Tardiphaga sp. TaxID=1926292 RepID=UPI0026330C22|nr:hypothetical protein [Tardiphaga sp.]
MGVTPQATGYAPGFENPPVNGEQIITRPRRRVQRIKIKEVFMLYSAALRTPPKKRAAVSGGFKVDNREASNRVDRSHSVSKQGQFDSYARKLNRS